MKNVESDYKNYYKGGWAKENKNSIKNRQLDSFSYLASMKMANQSLTLGQQRQRSQRSMQDNDKKLSDKSQMKLTIKLKSMAEWSVKTKSLLSSLNKSRAVAIWSSIKNIWGNQWAKNKSKATCMNSLMQKITTMRNSLRKAKKKCGLMKRKLLMSSNIQTTTKWKKEMKNGKMMKKWKKLMLKMDKITT